MTRRDITLTIPIYVPDLPGGLRSIREVSARIRRTVLTWRAQAAERRALAEMPDHLRRDMGLSLDALKREANKPFWRG